MKKQNHNILRLPGLTVPVFTVLFLLVSVTACDLFESSSKGEGTMKVMLHDNPGHYQEVWVDIQRVEVNNRLDAGSGWVVISEPQERYNLLELINGAQEVLGEAELEAGLYRQIRLILGDDNTIVVNDETYDLQTPSAQMTGLKLNINAEILEGSEYTLHLDFDVARSIVKKGHMHGQNQDSGSYSYLLKPVIRAYAQTETGMIAGVVEPADSNPWIYAIAGEDTVTSTRGEENTGEFRLLGLPGDIYSVSVVPAAEGYEEGYEVVIDNVEVSAGEVTDLGTITLEE